MLAVGLPYEHVLAMQRATEFMARLRGRVNGALHAGALAPETRDAIVRQRALYDETMRTFRRAAPDVAAQTTLSSPAIHASLQYIDRLLVRNRLDATDMAPDAWWSLATGAVEAHHAAAAAASADLLRQADRRMNEMDVRLHRTVMALVALGLLTLVLVLSTVGRIVLGLQRLLAGLKAVVEGGNFSTRIHGHARDEFGVISLGINTLIEAASNSVDAHEARSMTDALTGLMNRRGFDIQLTARTAHSRTHTLPLCLVMLDIDHFKSVNDTFGHASGDAVLRQLASVLQQSLRPDDVVARLGGEEFVALLPGCPLAEGVMVAEKLRAAVAAHDFQIGRQVTASFGIAPWRAEQAPDQFIATADACLYQSKHAGRNRVTSPAR
jgi:diguanylate cyclase (GGDEF)-like protein